MSLREVNNYGESSQQSTELFHLIFGNIKDYAILMTDLEGRVVSWNPGVEALLGYTESDIMGQSIAVIFTPEDVTAGVYLSEMHTAQTRGRAEGKRWHQRKDGSIFWATGMVIPVKNDAGMLHGFAKVMRDETAQKLLEEQLRESEEFNRCILESSVDCIKILDLDGILLSMNAPGLCIMEIDDFGDFKGRRWADFWSGEGHEKALRAVDAARRGEVGRFSGFAETAKGTRKFWDVIVSPMLDPNGKPKQILSVSRDITVQKRNEETIAKSKRRVENILESITDCFFTLDSERRFTYVNRQSETYFGMPKEQMLGRAFTEVLPKIKAHEILLRHEEALTRREPAHFEALSPLTGKWVELHLFPTDEGLAVYFRDITKRKQAEEALRESEERLRLAVAISQTSAFEINLLTDAVKTDDIGREIYGWGKDVPLTFSQVQTLFHPDDKEYVLQRVGAALAPEGPDEFEVEQRIVRTDGETRWIRVRGRAFFECEGESRRAVRCLGTYIDITESKQAEENLKNQKKLLSALTESVLDGILIVSPEGKLLHFNQHFLNIWNFPLEIIESKSDERALEWAANQTANSQEFRARVGAVYEHPNEKVREELVMKDGRVFERFGAPIHDDDNRNRLGWVWTFRDITTRKRIERNLVFLSKISQELPLLANSRDIKQAIAEKIGKYLGVSHCIFAEVDTVANTAFVNHGWRKDDVAIDLVGNYKLSEFVSDEFRQTLISRRPIVVNDVTTDSRTAEHAANFERLKIGSFINTPYVSEGDLKFVLGVYRHEPSEWRADEIELLGELMTRVWIRIERARAEENLRESEEQLRALADSISQLAWMAEPDGSIFWYNRRWYEYTGTTPAEMEGWGWQSVHDAEMLPSVLRLWQASIQTGEPFEMEFPLRRGADGAFRWFLTRIVPLHDTNGRIVRWFGTNTDIEELRQARLQAEQANRLKDEFLATLSHELRTPLNAILGWSQMLQTHNLGESEAKKAFATIERNARAQNQLIDDLLDVSRIITGKLRLDVRAVDLASVIRAAVDAARPAAEAKNIRLQTLLDPQTGTISGDPDRLQQVVWNLLSNAVKFTPKGGRVQARLERVNSHVEIIISDTGIGIEPDFLPHVFDRFRQSDGSMTRREGGLGLGLAIVRQLVELHGGTVSVESEGSGQGSTFTVHLPLLPVRREPVSEVPRVHPKAETGAPLDCPPELSDLRILLVDDEADSRDLLNLVLSSYGATVIVTSSASEAFEAVKRENFDVIVSDIGMPDEDGFSLIRKIRELSNEEGGDTPAIALTAYARAEDRVKALRSGFQMHVAKPVESGELIAIVANLAGRIGNPYRHKNA